MFPSVNPKTATLTTASPIQWSDGTLFDGFVMIGLAFPKDANNKPWPSLTIGQGKYPSQRLPIWVVVPVVQGTLDQNTKIFFNSAVDPPGSGYAAYWLDTTKKRLSPSGEGIVFTISISPYTLGVPSLSVPTVATVPTAPEV